MGQLDKCIKAGEMSQLVNWLFHKNKDLHAISRTPISLSLQGIPEIGDRDSLGSLAKPVSLRPVRYPVSKKQAEQFLRKDT